MAYCEVQFFGNAFDGAEDNLGNLVGKLQQAANNEAVNKFGYNYRPDPTDLQILPIETLDGLKFLVRAYHSTESPRGQTAIYQPHDFSFWLSKERDGSYLRTDSEYAYPLNAREHSILKNLAKIATAQSVDIISTE
jgi:hypothetical protein